MASYVKEKATGQFCLPQKYTAAFIAGLRDGTFDPGSLAQKTSIERREIFAQKLGPENAREVNALFESKLLLKNQKEGMLKWARQLAGTDPKIIKTIEDQIQGMDKILNPVDAKMFLADLVNKKLGIDVSAVEAKQLFEAAKKTSDLKTKMLQSTDQKPGSPDRIAWGRSQIALNEMVEQMKPNPGGFWHWTNQILGTPKSALTSVFHLSAPVVQGWGMLGTKQWYQGIGKMLQYLASEDKYQDLRAYIISHPDYQLALDGKLGLTDIGNKLSNREEALQSSLLQQLNTHLSDQFHLPNIIKGSSRAFTGYLNYVRFERYMDLVRAARLSGEDVRAGSQVLKDIASQVNNFTGRANLGKGEEFANTVGLLNSVFFAPRKMLATFEMFNPVNYLKPQSATARMAAMRQLTGSLLATFAISTLAQQCGYSVNMNPISQDFMKVHLPGGLKLDITGGNAVYTRLLARIITNQMINSKGDQLELGAQQKGGYTTPTRADMVIQWMRGKLSPVGSAIADAMYGKDPTGREVTISNELRNKLTPIPMQAFFHMTDNYPQDAGAILPALSVIFGVGLEAPLPPLSKSGLTTWGEPVQEWSLHEQPRTDLDNKLDAIGITPRFPPETINGVKLTPKQYHEYIFLSGTMAKQQLENVFSHPGIDKINKALLKNFVNDTIKGARSRAAGMILAESINSDNNIPKKSLQELMKKYGVETPDQEQSTEPNSAPQESQSVSP